MGAERLAAAGPRAWAVWLRTILGAVAANLVLRAAALAVFDIRPSSSRWRSQGRPCS